MRILSLAPLAGPGLDILRSIGELTVDPWNDHVPVRFHAADELVARLDGVDALIVEADAVSADVIERSALRIIGVCRGTPANVDIESATKHGVVVIRAPARNAGAVADLTLGLIYGLLRHIGDADDDIRAGRWIVEGTIPQQRFGGSELASCTVGLVGFGAIGRTVASRLRALGALVCAYDPYVDAGEIRALGVEPVAGVGELFARADIVSLHATLTDDTRGMIGEAELARARPGALLVNTARYGLVDEPALIAALRDGRLGGAAFDHFENEYLPPDHPLVGMPNVILTPHIGGSTRETVENHTMTVALAIAEVLEGRVPASAVNPEVLPIT